MILCANPRAQYLAHREEIDAAMRQALERGQYILGDEVRAFEQEFASYVGVAHGVGVGSGTEALHLALVACGIGRGHEVITVAHTAVATVAAIELAGATPVLVDIEPEHYTMDPSAVAAVITPRTKAIVPVHLYGQPADLEPILIVARDHQLRVIEDCAQAHGARYRGQHVGSHGHVGCFSFYPTKNLGALGDGGMVVTDDAELARRMRTLREYGWTDRYISDVPGWNTRLDELQAAVLRVKLRYLDEDNRARARLAGAYALGLAEADLVLPRLRPSATHVYHLYVVRSRAREVLQSFLKSRGISALVHYPVPIHLQPAYRGRSFDGARLPETELAAREVLSLPMYPQLTENEVASVVEAVRAAAVLAS